MLTNALLCGRRSLLLLLITCLVTGCASLRPGWETPDVNVLGIAPANSGAGHAGAFAIRLQIINPNDTPLSISGVYYRLEVEGNRLLSGAYSEPIPDIGPYGQQVVTVVASPNAVGLAMTMVDMLRMTERHGSVDRLKYRLDAKIGLSNSLAPAIRVSKKGEIDMRSGAVRGL
jgi:LEA14-like dessication related protein